MPRKKQGTRIIGLRKLKDKNAYTFGLCCLQGLLVNGFTYFPATGSVRSPYLRSGNKSNALVKGFGVHWAKIREIVKIEVERFENEISNSNGSSTDGA